MSCQFANAKEFTGALEFVTRHSHTFYKEVGCVEGFGRARNGYSSKV